jgi:microcystin-dependent protein
VQDGIGYKFVQKDALDNLIWSEDNVQVPQIAVPVTSTSAAVPPGTLMAYGGTTAPTGWLLCQGQPAATTGLYADLFAVILYRFGGAGGTFYIPDMRGKFPLGTAASGTGSTLAGTGGTIDHVHTGATHTHPVAAHTHTIAHHHSVPRDGWGETSAAQTPGRLQTCPTSGSGSESTVTQANTTTVTGDVDAPNSGTNTLGIITGDPSAANTGTANPPFLSLNFIIKYSLT